MNTIDAVIDLSAAQCRIFWLALPPLKPAARMEAARLALRARVANPTAVRLLMPATVAPNGRWCIGVVDDGVAAATAPQSRPAAARTPWQPGDVAWNRSAADPHCITAAGESIALTHRNALPDEVLQACAHPAAQRLVVYGETTAEDAALWRAQTGITVAIAPPARTGAESMAWMPTMANARPLSAPPGSIRSSGVAVAAKLALAAGLIHLSASAVVAWNARRDAQAVVATQVALANEYKSTTTDWREMVKQRAPAQARDSAAGLLQIALPALATTADRVKSVQFQANALSIEWTSLSEGERAAFDDAIRIAGASAVIANTKARVIWP